MKYKDKLVNEIIIIRETFYYGNVKYKVMVTKGKEYYNIYVTNEYFKEEQLNNLQLQEPIDCVDVSIFDKQYCECKALEFYLWFKYSTNDKVKDFCVEEVE